MRIYSLYGSVTKADNTEAVLAMLSHTGYETKEQKKKYNFLATTKLRIRRDDDLRLNIGAKAMCFLSLAPMRARPKRVRTRNESQTPSPCTWN